LLLHFYLKIALFQENGEKIPSIYTDFQRAIGRSSKAETLFFYLFAPTLEHRADFSVS
jgi:hypothetical protein